MVPFLKHERAMIRRAAIFALAALDLKNRAALLQQLIGDASPGVSKAAATVFAARISLLNTESLTELLNHSEHTHVRANAFALLARLPVWASGVIVLTALRHRDPAIAAAAKATVPRWLSRTSSLPIGPDPRTNRAPQKRRCSMR